MRLTDLEAHWLTVDDRQGVGILFLCPACLETDNGNGLGHSIAVYFSNPLDGGPAVGPEHRPLYRWLRGGKTIEDLSIVPSIHASCWHGFVRRGEIITANKE